MWVEKPSVRSGWFFMNTLAFFYVRVESRPYVWYDIFMYRPVQRKYAAKAAHGLRGE